MEFKGLSDHQGSHVVSISVKTSHSFVEWCYLFHWWRGGVYSNSQQKIIPGRHKMKVQ